MVNLLLYNVGLRQSGVVGSRDGLKTTISEAVCRGEKGCNLGTVVVIEELFTKILSHESRVEKRREDCVIMGSCEGCPFGAERIG